MGMKIGQTAMQFANMRDQQRIVRENRRSTEASKESRTQKKQAKLDENTRLEQVEGILYGPGVAD